MRILRWLTLLALVASAASDPTLASSVVSNK